MTNIFKKPETYFLGAAALVASSYVINKVNYESSIPIKVGHQITEYNKMHAVVNDTLNPNILHIDSIDYKIAMGVSNNESGHHPVISLIETKIKYTIPGSIPTKWNKDVSKDLVLMKAKRVTRIITDDISTPGFKRSIFDTYDAVKYFDKESKFVFRKYDDDLGYYLTDSLLNYPIEAPEGSMKLIREGDLIPVPNKVFMMKNLKKRIEDNRYLKLNREFTLEELNKLEIDEINEDYSSMLGKFYSRFKDANSKIKGTYEGMLLAEKKNEKEMKKQEQLRAKQAESRIKNEQQQFRNNFFK